MIDFSLFENRTFLGSGVSPWRGAQRRRVMVFYLLLFLQNAYGFDVLRAGFPPCCLSPCPWPQGAARDCASRREDFRQNDADDGPADNGDHNVLSWRLLMQTSATLFVIGMLAAGSGAGILNGETVKVLSASVPPERSGMASAARAQPAS